MNYVHKPISISNRHAQKLRSTLWSLTSLSYRSAIRRPSLPSTNYQLSYSASMRTGSPIGKTGMSVNTSLGLTYYLRVSATRIRLLRPRLRLRFSARGFASSRPIWPKSGVKSCCPCMRTCYCSTNILFG